MDRTVTLTPAQAAGLSLILPIILVVVSTICRIIILCVKRRSERNEA